MPDKFTFNNACQKILLMDRKFQDTGVLGVNYVAIIWILVIWVNQPCLVMQREGKAQGQWQDSPHQQLQ